MSTRSQFSRNGEQDTPAAFRLDTFSFDGFKAILRPEEGWLVLFLATMLFLVTVWAVEGAGWVREMPGLSGLTLLAVLISYVLSRFKVWALLLHPLGAFLGLVAGGWLTITVADGATFEEQAIDAALRLNEFWIIAQEGGISTDGLPFAVQVIILAWLVAYGSTWFLYRHHNVWLALVPPAIALLVNLTYLPGRFGEFFFMFVLLGLVLVMASQRSELQRHWRNEKVSPNEMRRAGSMAPVFFSGGILLALVFWMPHIGQSLPVTIFWEQTTAPWRSFEREFDRLFASLSSGQVAPLHSFGGALPLRGAVNFGDELAAAGRMSLARNTVFFVQADEPGNWRAETYSVYTGLGWVQPPRTEKALPQNPVQGAINEYQERVPFTQTMEPVSSQDILFYRGLPIYGNTPAKGEVSEPLAVTLDLDDLGNNNALSPTLQELARTLRASLRNPGRLVTQQELQRLLPPDLRVTRPAVRGAEVLALDIRRTESFPPDFNVVRPSVPVGRRQAYSVTSSISVAPVELLQEAGREYPGWVTDRYLQLPQDLPPRVMDTAREWTKDVTTPFDQAVAIEAKLREFEYSTNIPPPPRESDGVDYFLSTRRGYADYYASAMAVMLRGVGIPSRVVVGYVSGDWDSQQEHYVVQESHAHAWVDVFFPAYGWVEFNPSPNWPTFPRRFLTSGGFAEEDELFDDDLLEGGDLSEPLEEEDEFIDPGILTGGTDQTKLLVALAIIGASIGFVTLLLRFLWELGMRSLSFSAQVYEKMCRLAGLAGLAPKAQETPHEYAQTIGRSLPRVQGDADEIAQGYARSRYSQEPLTPEEMTGINKAWMALRQALFIGILVRIRRFGRPPRP